MCAQYSKILHKLGHCNIALQYVRNIPETLHKCFHSNITRQCVRNIPETLHKCLHSNITRRCVRNISVTLHKFAIELLHGNVPQFCSNIAMQLATKRQHCNVLQLLCNISATKCAVRGVQYFHTHSASACLVRVRAQVCTRPNISETFRAMFQMLQRNGSATFLHQSVL